MSLLKVPPQISFFFARLISNSFTKNSNLPNIHYDMLARSFVQLLYVVFVKSSDRLLNYLILYPEFIEVKMETVRTLEFCIW